MAIEGRCEWSASHRAFVFHPEWPEPAPPPEAPRPGEAAAAGGLRPAGFEDFAGQREVVEDLLIAGRAARERGEPLGHVLLDGPSGLGKTTIARLLAREFGTSFLEVVAGNIGDPHQLVSILARLGKGGVLLIDEVHGLGPACEESLYPAMEDRAVSVVLHEGAMAKCVRIRLEPFTLVAATTKAGVRSFWRGRQTLPRIGRDTRPPSPRCLKGTVGDQLVDSCSLLSDPFLARFRHIERLEPYEEEDLARVAAGAAARMGTTASPEAAREVARRSRGTAREAVRMVERARGVPAAPSLCEGRRVAQVEKAGGIDLAHVVHAASRSGIDANGLDRVERRAVRLLLERGRPIGRESLAARLGVDIDTYRRVHEPWLERAGLVERTEGGRVATRKARMLYPPDTTPKAPEEEADCPRAGS